MHKEQLITHLAKKNRRPKEYYRTALKETLAGIQEQLAQGKEVTFMGFGTFYTRMKKAGKARDFKTGKPIDYKPVRQAAFRAGHLLKQAVRKKKSLFSL